MSIAVLVLVILCLSPNLAFIGELDPDSTAELISSLKTLSTSYFFKSRSGTGELEAGVSAAMGELLFELGC